MSSRRQWRAAVASGGGGSGVRAVPVVVTVEVEADVAQEPGGRRVAAQRRVARPTRVASTAVADETLLVGAQRQRRVHPTLADFLQHTNTTRLETRLQRSQHAVDYTATSFDE